MINQCVCIYDMMLFSLVGIYSHSWQTGTLEVTTPYVYRSPQQFRGVVGVHVALHGANITLIGKTDVW